MTRSLTAFLAAALALALLALPARAFETSAKAAYALDMTTDTVLLSKNPHAPLPPASMSKLMTLYVTFEAIRDGRLALDEKLPVSKHAMSYGGSTMFLDTTDRVTVEALLRGIIVLSGNDACAVLAEALSPDGTEAGFARYITRRGKQMGLTNSTFKNSNGWPAPGHRMSVRDLALLARRIIEDFPEFYPMFAETEYAFDGRAPQNTQNRNPLLRLGIGADGLKTGHTQRAGYGLVGSAKQDGRRIIVVLSGIDTARRRAEEAEAMLTWGFRQFAEKSLVRAGTRVASADVWMGAAPGVGLVPAGDVSALVPAVGSDTLDAEVIYDGPVRAPVSEGDELARLVFTPEGLPQRSVPLFAASDVARGGFLVRLRTVSQLLLDRLRRGPEGQS